MTGPDLAEARVLLGWTLSEMAAQVGCDRNMVALWQREGPPDCVAVWVDGMLRYRDQNPAPQGWRKRRRKNGNRELARLLSGDRTDLREYQRLHHHDAALPRV